MPLKARRLLFESIVSELVISSTIDSFFFIGQVDLTVKISCVIGHDVFLQERESDYWRAMVITSVTKYVFCEKTMVQKTT